MVDPYTSMPTKLAGVIARQNALLSLAAAGSGFEEGRRRTPVDIVGGSPRRVRESLTSYLLSVSQVTTRNMHNEPPIAAPLTPPSSLTSDVQPMITFPFMSPLTPESSNGSLEHRSISNDDSTTEINIPLLAFLFPFHASQLSGISTALELVTPPDHVLTGFVCDHTNGRTIYVHLPPPHASSHRPEALSANFSDVLRPHDPSKSPRQETSSPLDGLDIRECLTAILDLACDQLQANALVLALDKDDRETEGLDELLHSLMYVGGQVLPPGKGALDGGWEWDPTRWVLVGVEL